MPCFSPNILPDLDKISGTLFTPPVTLGWIIRCPQRVIDLHLSSFLRVQVPHHSMTRSTLKHRTHPNRQNIRHGAIVAYIQTVFSLFITHPRGLRDTHLHNNVKGRTKLLNRYSLNTNVGHLCQMDKSPSPNHSLLWIIIRDRIHPPPPLHHSHFSSLVPFTPFLFWGTSLWISCNSSPI